MGLALYLIIRNTCFRTIFVFLVQLRLAPERGTEAALQYLQKEFPELHPKVGVAMVEDKVGGARRDVGEVRVGEDRWIRRRHPSELNFMD